MSAEDPPSVIGTMATLTDGQVLLPGFIIKREKGLYVDISALDSRELLPRFVSKVFEGGARFLGLNYPLFLKLLYQYTIADIGKLLERAEAAKQPAELLLAKDIVAFPPERLALYRGFKMVGEVADYYFEQISIDREIEERTTGLTDDDGLPLPDQVDTYTVTERAYLDFDEFVGALWLKGVRAGIDAPQVRATIAADKADRLTVAQKLPPQQGRDATLEERSKALHRDDSPKLLPDGRVDLCHFSNRFPQVTAGENLVCKVPRVPGVSGWDIQGRELEPDPLKDFDIEKIAGPGTRIERAANGDQLIVAAIDGFLDIDTKTSQFSISEKIVSRAGVSVRTTGDLSLAGDEFEEHGEVQEKRNVKGHHMTFFADVFGNVESNGGRVVFKKTISGGTAKSPGGSIVVEGSASRAVLDAHGGSVDVAIAESSVLIGKEVRVGKAVSCNIVAEIVVIEHSEGSAIAAKDAKIAMSGARKAEGTVLTMLLPDVAHFNSKVAKLEKEKVTIFDAVVLKRAKLTEMASQGEMKTYLALQPKIKAKTISMTMQQEMNWQVMVTRLGASLREYAKLHGEVGKLQAAVTEIDEQIKTLKQQCASESAAVHCEIGEVFGDTIVRQRLLRADTPALETLPVKDLHTKLHEAGSREDRIFTDDSGSVKWSPPVQETF